MGTEFERDVMHKLGEIEAKLDSLVGNGQPGRMKLAEDRIALLEAEEVKRGTVERVITWVTAVVVSALTALGIRLVTKW